MLFHKIEFVVFFSIVFALYWFVFQRNLRWQNVFLIVASYAFYAWADWLFLILLLGSSTFNYFIALQIEKSVHNKKSKILLYIGVTINLLLLGFFKYFNFFTDAIANSFSLFGVSLSLPSLSIILPVGISFYTFQHIGYIIDVYRGDIKAQNNVITFTAFSSFFPQLLSGPIARATTMLPQFEQKRHFDYEASKDAMRQILWGLVKKVVIADNLMLYTDNVFSLPSHYGGGALLLGIVFYSFQIYCDFSGYSDMAIGTARLLGFTINTNFALPYFSTNITELWRRWHISLSTWFRDYLFTPLSINFRNLGIWGIILASFISFFLIGLWHNASYTNVFYGILQGLVIAYEILSRKIRKKMSKKTPSVVYISVSILFTQLFWCFSILFFRSSNMHEAFEYLYRIGQNPFDFQFSVPIEYFYYIGILLLLEIIHRNRKHSLDIQYLPTFVRWSLYLVLVGIYIYYGNFNASQDFIYFQF